MSKSFPCQSLQPINRKINHNRKTTMSLCVCKCYKKKTHTNTHAHTHTQRLFIHFHVLSRSSRIGFAVFFSLSSTLSLVLCRHLYKLPFNRIECVNFAPIHPARLVSSLSWVVFRLNITTF